MAETATRRRGAKRAMSPIGRSATIEHRKVPWQGVLGGQSPPNVSPSARRRRKKLRAMLPLWRAQPDGGNELVRPRRKAPLVSSCNKNGLFHRSPFRLEKGFVFYGGFAAGAQGGEGAVVRRSTPCGLASSSARCANIARVFSAAAAAPRAGGTPSPCTPWQEPEVPAPPAFYSEPCGLVSSSARCANIARFFVRLRPRRGQEGLRPPAPPGRNLRFLHLPPLLRAMRPCQLVRALRDHCAILCAAAAAPMGLRVGAPPPRPWQGTQFPAPSPFYSKPCNLSGGTHVPSHLMERLRRS